MTPKRTVEDVVVAWISLQRGEPDGFLHDENPNWWAFWAMWNLEKHEPELCLDVILRIMNATSNPDVLGALSAGPLEEVLATHGARIIDRVEKLADENAKFLQLFGGVWRNAMTDEIWRRVEPLRERAKEKRAENDR